MEEVFYERFTPKKVEKSKGLSLLRKELENIRQEKEEFRKLYLKSLADFKNFKKRQEEEIKKIKDLSAERVIAEILPVLDNFERALAASNNIDDPQSLQKGIVMIYNQILDVLKKEGLEPFDSVGNEFNPEIHEAVEVVENEDCDNDIVIKEISKGYFLKSKLLRPARVIIGKKTKKDIDENEEK